MRRVRRIVRRAAAGATPAAAAAALVAISLSGCGAATPAQTATQQYVVPPVSVSAAQAAKLPQATTYTTISAAPADPARFAATSGLVVHPLAAQIVYAGPGKAPVAVLPATELGGPTWVPVIRTGPGWDQVLLPSRPDHITGWIYTGGANAKLDTRRTSYLLRVDLAAHRLSVYSDGKLLGAWTVAIGAPGTPTPTGRTFLLALLAPASPTYSPLIVPLGTHSNALSTYGGGPGTVGIHGWPDTSVFGQSVSNGCVRVPAAALHLVSTIPLGSLVVIS